jgi:NitT/TauT family transport system ATP-binding protein
MPKDGDGAGARESLEAVGKTYGPHGREVHAVDHVTFDISEGEFVALIGPSGWGKSTILNMVAGLLPASSGRSRWARTRARTASSASPG